MCPARLLGESCAPKSVAVGCLRLARGEGVAREERFPAAPHAAAAPRQDDRQVSGSAPAAAPSPTR